ncbi:hypothetical protein BTUL_0267g00070 [Botrytis tulipae]|uniref:Uncharacterized protein n=1 Tax=Botrytis tulipae TaxID=87230 RepID=A0A4Z1E8I5_9HELO|nr:hypothetical protein BTUL_0267g00070 [Botrytis tulipae]
MRPLDLNVFAGILLFLGRLHLVATGAVFIEPYAKIVQFQATVIVPKAPTILQATGIQSFWPAIEPANSNSILQIVYANEGETLGRWSFFEYFQLGNALAGGERIHGKNINVYPEDLISNGFISMDSSEQWKGPTKSYKWFVHWTGRRGAEGLANGEAILATELNRAAKWEMGPLDWKNVLIQIEGTNMDWCSIDKLILSNVTLSNIESVRVLPGITGMICFFKGFTVMDSTASV